MKIQGTPEPKKRRTHDHHRGKEQSRARRRILAKIKRNLDGNFEEESRSSHGEVMDRDPEE